MAASKTQRDVAARRMGYADQNERRRVQALYKRHGLPVPTRKPTAANIRRVSEGKRPRDYAAEEKRRNDKARAAGYKNRYGKRIGKHVTEDGKEYSHDLIMACTMWSMQNAARWQAKFDISHRPDGITKEAYTIAYYNAFLGPESYDNVVDRSKYWHKGGSPALYLWFTHFSGVGMGEVAYLERYGF